jgi:hypothetical protein
MFKITNKNNLCLGFGAWCLEFPLKGAYRGCRKEGSWEALKIGNWEKADLLICC